MDPLPHILTQVFAAQPHMPPPSLNDDDLYLVDLRTMKPLASFGCASATAQDARYHGMNVLVGQGLLKGMQLRHMQAARAEVSA